MTMSTRLMRKAYRARGGRPGDRHNERVLYLAIGEWVTSTLLFSAAFVVALLGIVGIAVYVLRGDRLNRASIDGAVESESPAVHEGH